ncbi:MAG: type I-A CRISPR-associated protein Cas4/Csa1 [Peptococcaceae bacterium]|nr:MAG: type I-A CRISPR-associated protein Cas4/Csa1 [Peptococcaceae bacterium]
MYFLTEEERKLFLKKLLPKSREMSVAEELRGWNWHQPPLEPIYDVKLALYEIAGKYCTTGRDLYLKKVQGVKVKPNKAMLMGSIFHEILLRILVNTKKLIYLKGVNGYREILEGLQQNKNVELESYKDDFNQEELSDIQRKVALISEFETSRIAARIQEALSKHPYIGEDALVSLVVPVLAEQKLDGSFLGLSHHLSADAFMFSEPMIIDLKFGDRKDFHRLATTGYAMVMEAMYEYPVNTGCLIYAEFRGNRLVISKDLHIIDDELRQWFIEERDEKMRMIYDEIDPGLAAECPETCPYYIICHGE